MKRLIVLIIFLVCTTIAYCQQYQDVVYLKNGRVIKGQIMEQVPNVSLQIVTSNGTMIFPMNEIERITKEIINERNNSGEVNDVLNPYYKPETSTPNPDNKQNRTSSDNNKPTLISRNRTVLHEPSGLQKGFTGFIETGYSLSVYKNEDPSEVVHGNFVAAYRYNPYLAVGVGAGIRYFAQHGKTLLPVFASLRMNMRDSKVTPYAHLDVGYAGIPSENFSSFGTLLAEGVGVSVKLANKNSLRIGFRFETRIFDGSANNNYLVSQIFSSNYHSLGFNLGLSF